MQQQFVLLSILLVSLLQLAPTLIASETGWGPDDYPCWRGPSGSGGPYEPAIRPQLNLKQPKLVWTSEAQFPTCSWSNRKQRGVAGGYGSPIVCAGRVFVGYYRPSGEIEDKSYNANFNANGKLDKFVKAGKYKVAADDVFVCMDAATGKTIWKRELMGMGINFNHSSQGPHGLPVATAQRVYFLTTFGYLYCFDAKTGETIWRSTLGPATEWLTAKREECLRTGKMFNNFNQSKVFNANPALADGVIATGTNDFRTAKQQAYTDLIGIDAETGKILWTIPDAAAYAAAPLRWEHKGKAYFISYNYKRLLCIEARSGTILWEVKDHKWTGATIAVSHDHLVLHSKHRRNRSKGESVVPHGHLLCYRITPDKATLAWKLISGGSRGKPPWGWGSPVIDQASGTVFGCARSPKDGRSMYAGIDLETGAFTFTDNCKGNQNHLHLAHGVVWNGTMPYARHDGTSWKTVEQPPKSAWIPYLEYTSPVVANGRMYSRGGEDGRVYCYDLR